jgi:hypothetical protein
MMPADALSGWIARNAARYGSESEVGEGRSAV